MKEKKDNKKIHNYLILAGIFAVSILIVFYLCNWYKVYDEYQKQTPVIRGSLQEIVTDDLEHYLMDNPSVVIYMCTSSDEVCRDFEKSFKKLISKEELNGEIVYLNLSDVDKKTFVDDFNNKYSHKNKLKDYYPAFVVFEDGKVNSIIQGSEDKKLTISRVKQFLELNEIGE